jgi:hypothetical protein
VEDAVFSLINYALNIHNVKDFISGIKSKLDDGKSKIPYF